jgi:hypothetical protein
MEKYILISMRKLGPVVLKVYNVYKQLYSFYWVYPILFTNDFHKFIQTVLP